MLNSIYTAIFVGFLSAPHYLFYKSMFSSKYNSHYRSIIQLGIPIVIGQIGIVLVGLVDNIMVGRFATQHLAAASFVNSVFNIPILFGLGFAYGLTPLVGQAFGRGDSSAIGSLIRNSLLVNVIIGILLSCIMTFVYFNIENLGQPQELMHLIKPYFLLQLASLPFVMLFNTFKQFSDGITDTKTPMYIMLSGNLLNIIGNFILIYGIGSLEPLGVIGAGISTLTSRIVMALVFIFIFFYKNRYKSYADSYHAQAINRSDLWSLNRMGWMIGIQMGMETALFSFTGIMVGWLGTLALASHQIIVSISTVGFMIYYGVGAAISVRVSNYFGNRDIKNVRKTTIAGFHIILLLALIAASIFIMIRHYIAYIFTTEVAVVDMVATLMFIMAGYQFGDAIQITFANALRGLGDVVSMAFISFIGYFLIAIPVSYICAFVFDWGLAGIWSGYPVGLTLTGAMLWIRFHILTKRLA